MKDNTLIAMCVGGIILCPILAAVLTQENDSPMTSYPAQFIKLPAGVSATCEFSIDTSDLAIVVVTEKYDGPSFVNIPIRDQHGNFLGSLQLDATP